MLSLDKRERREWGFVADVPIDPSAGTWMGWSLLGSHAWLIGTAAPPYMRAVPPWAHDSFTGSRQARRMTKTCRLAAGPVGLLTSALRRPTATPGWIRASHC